MVYHEAYFKGTMLNNDTIVDWHMVPPYPNEDVKVNNNFEFFTQPKLLYFIENPEMKQLDSLMLQARTLKE